MTDLFGATPRVRLLSALVRIGPLEVTRAEIAQEAGLFKTSANRALDQLRKDKLIRRVSGGHRPRYRVNATLAEVQLLGLLAAALETVTADPRDTRGVVERFRSSALWVTETYHNETSTSSTWEASIGGPSDVAPTVLDVETPASASASISSSPPGGGEA